MLTAHFKNPVAVKVKKSRPNWPLPRVNLKIRKAVQKRTIYSIYDSGIQTFESCSARNSCTVLYRNAYLCDLWEET